MRILPPHVTVFWVPSLTAQLLAINLQAPTAPFLLSFLFPFFILTLFGAHRDQECGSAEKVACIARRGVAFSRLRL